MFSRYSVILLWLHVCIVLVLSGFVWWSEGTSASELLLLLTLLKYTDALSAGERGLDRDMDGWKAETEREEGKEVTGVPCLCKLSCISDTRLLQSFSGSLLIHIPLCAWNNLCQSKRNTEV